MPILNAIKQRVSVEQPFKGHKIGICLHVEAKSGVWIETLMAGGAKVAITGSPGSTQDDTAAYLVREMGVEVFAWRSETFDDHMENAKRVLATAPTIIADNGGDLHFLLGKDDAFFRRSSLTTRWPSVLWKTGTASVFPLSMASCGRPTSCWVARRS
jgi:adenosylhomocysteinase